MPAFGRIPSPDVRDQAFPMEAHIDWTVALPDHKFWSVRESTDQGNLGACVGASWRNWLQAAPVMTKIGEGPTWRQIYDQAQILDPFPGQEPEVSGSTVRAGAQALQQWGYIQSYVWADTIATAKAFILQNGPVVFGTNWLSGMMTPDGNNVIHATGGVQGGHAYLVTGFSSRKGCFRIHNSWSRQWGWNGSAYISEADLTKVFAQGGECCTAVQVPI